MLLDIVDDNTSCYSLIELEPSITYLEFIKVKKISLSPLTNNGLAQFSSIALKFSSVVKKTFLQWFLIALIIQFSFFDLFLF